MITPMTNYLQWLDDRGVMYPTFVTTEPAGVTLLAQGRLSAEEQALVTKMMAAIGAPSFVTSSDTKSVSADSPTLVLGIEAARSLLGSSDDLYQFRKSLRDHPHLRITFHPRDLILVPELKRQAWADLKDFQKLIVGTSL